MSVRQHQAAASAQPTASLPAAASRGVRHILEGPRRPGVLLGMSSNAAWLQARGHVLVLTGPDGVRLPNGIMVTKPARVVPTFSEEQCVVGEGRVEVGNLKISIVRWWDPRPVLEPAPRESVATLGEDARSRLPGIDDGGLGKALMSDDPAAVRHAMCGLLGKGEGLTPEGDDVLVGMLAGLRLLGPALGVPGAGEVQAAVAPIVLTEAPFRTTALSATLLRHAVAGEVADPVATFLQALTGRGSMEEATVGLKTMGNTSGVATACGILLAADYLVARSDA
ncbi:MAG: DUF2877 domain-containing protein [Acidimicrobiia bacterium]